MSNAYDPMDYLQLARLLWQQNLPSKNVRMGCHFLSQEIFLGIKLGSPTLQVDSLPTELPGKSPNGLEWVDLIQMTIMSTTVGKNPLEKMVQPLQSTRVQNAVLECNLTNERMISVCLQGQPFNITVMQVYALTSNLNKLMLNSSMMTYKIFQN